MEASGTVEKLKREGERERKIGRRSKKERKRKKEGRKEGKESGRRSGRDKASRRERKGGRPRDFGERGKGITTRARRVEREEQTYREKEKGDEGEEEKKNE